MPLRPARREGEGHSVLLRRHPERPDEVYLVYAPDGTPLPAGVRVAGVRWRIDALFTLAKGQVGLDHDEVRGGHGWYRHITLALLALAVLTVGARTKGGLPARPISRSRSQKSGGCSSGSSGMPASLRARTWRPTSGTSLLKRPRETMLDFTSSSDVMGVEFADGTAQIQKIIVAHELFGRNHLPYEPATRRLPGFCPPARNRPVEGAPAGRENARRPPPSRSGEDLRLS
jgi:hypothetical protein